MKYPVKMKRKEEKPRERGVWKIGPGRFAACFETQGKPPLFHRIMARVLLGWTWEQR